MRETCKFVGLATHPQELIPVVQRLKGVSPTFRAQILGGEDRLSLDILKQVRPDITEDMAAMLHIPAEAGNMRFLRNSAPIQVFHPELQSEDVIQSAAALFWRKIQFMIEHKEYRSQVLLTTIPSSSLSPVIINDMVNARASGMEIDACQGGIEEVSERVHAYAQRLKSTASFS